MRSVPIPLEQVLINLPDGITIQDREFNIIFQNDAMEKAFGVHLGEKCYAIYDQRDRICERCGVRKVFETGKPSMVIRTATLADGTTSYWENSCFPLFDHQGNIVAGVEVCRNINDRVSLEAEVEERNVELGQLNRELNQKTVQLEAALDKSMEAERQIQESTAALTASHTDLQRAYDEVHAAQSRILQQLLFPFSHRPTPWQGSRGRWLFLPCRCMPMRQFALFATNKLYKFVRVSEKLDLLGGDK